jgi:hypothetical protein
MDDCHLSNITKLEKKKNTTYKSSGADLQNWYMVSSFYFFPVIVIPG